MNRIDLLESYVQEDPADPFNHYALCLELVKVDRLQDARAKFSYLVESHPHYLPTYFHYGKLLEHLGEPAIACEIYQKGIRIAVMQNDRKTEAELRTALDFIE